MSSRRTEFSRRAARWLLPAAVLAFTPKCLLCVAAYVGLGAALGLATPELCGGAANASTTWASSLAWLGLICGLSAFGFRA
ncbi:MAG TPA: hypothetical protein VEA63_16270, partial [Opitutus sp.]|nr:hypothetical protein [Opitutus sp.]